ncbi:MAG: HD domain-containing protein [Spirochaetales bacterium]|jgi:HD superfamily phosphohydrolase|nr:HD domain-containing protein [Spirochaetales bacterium]
MEWENIIRHLDRDYSEPIRDPLWKHIYLSPAMMSLVAAAPFRKIGGIKQLGVTHLVYPGATHTRFVHSLGVFCLAKRIIRGLLASPQPPDLSLEGVKAFLCAALLHDIGHFPFTHSLKELPLKSHETLTAELILDEPLAGLIRKKVGADPQLCAAIVDEEISLSGNAKNSEAGFFRRILSGVLDPDKLDYLNRDAYYCGVPYGVQDTDFVIDRIHPHPLKGIALDEGGVPAVENILFSKYLMYRTVYWHRTVRIATAMIKKAVFLALAEGVIAPEDLYGLDDEDFFRTIGEKDYPPFALIRKAAARDLYKTAAEISCEGSAFSAWSDLSRRAQAEALLAKEISRETGVPLKPEEVIIDIPEKIKFEVELPILKPDGSVQDYALADSVFSAPVPEGFSRPLRVLRLAIPAEAAGKLKNGRELLLRLNQDSAHPPTSLPRLV